MKDGRRNTETEERRIRLCGILCIVMRKMRIAIMDSQAARGFVR
jgi:hypothetical protein